MSGNEKEVRGERRAQKGTPGLYSHATDKHSSSSNSKMSASELHRMSVWTASDSSSWRRVAHTPSMISLAREMAMEQFVLNAFPAGFSKSAPLRSQHACSGPGHNAGPVASCLLHQRTCEAGANRRSLMRE